jgi:hypothetical protein
MAKKILNAQRLRVVAGQKSEISFFTNAKQVRDGVGDNASFNSSVQAALDQLEFAEIESISGVFAGNRLQLDKWGDHAIKFPQVGKSVLGQT